ncbi:MAG: hypothetical protein AM1032_000366 [Mycoplasmataceae bacterium]|nr:MAG: hypothetical protein AM1032_000366 [Mycoplasmataceae bacterium]
MYSNNYNNNNVKQKENDIINWINGNESEDQHPIKQNCPCRKCELFRINKFFKINKDNYYENLSIFFKNQCNDLNVLNIELRKELSYSSLELSKTRSQYSKEISHLNSRLSISENNLSVLSNVYNEFYEEYTKLKKREQELFDYIKKIDLRSRFEELNSDSDSDYSQLTLVESLSD